MEQMIPATDGGKLWMAISGSGPPVLLISGGPGCCDYLEPVASLIDDLCTAVRFDFRGCGRSSPADEYSVASQLEDIESVRKHLGVDRWVVVGHSWAADLAVIYALEHPQHTAAIVPIAGGRMNNDRDWSAAYQQGRDEGRESHLEFAFEPNMEVNRQVNASNKAYIKRPGLFLEIAECQVPARFVYGERDIRPAWASEQVARLLPNGEFHVIPGADHHIWLTHSGELGGLLRPFIAPHVETEGRSSASSE